MARNDREGVPLVALERLGTLANRTKPKPGSAPRVGAAHDLCESLLTTCVPLALSGEHALRLGIVAGDRVTARSPGLEYGRKTQ